MLAHPKLIVFFLKTQGVSPRGRNIFLKRKLDLIFQNTHDLQRMMVVRFSLNVELAMIARVLFIALWIMFVVRG